MARFDIFLRLIILFLSDVNFNGCPYQNLLSLDLNVLREGASTTSLGNKFQAFSTLFENTFARTFSLDHFFE